MKAQINLFLKDDNSFKGIYEGNAVELALMLQKMGIDSAQAKSAILIAAAALLKDDGDKEIANRLLKKLQNP